MEASTVDPLYDRDPSAEALRFLEEDSDDDTLSNAFLGVLDRREATGSGKGSPDAVSLRNDDEESVDRSMDETTIKSFTNDIFDGSLSPRIALQKQQGSFVVASSLKGGEPAKKDEVWSVDKAELDSAKQLISDLEAKVTQQQFMMGVLKDQVESMEREKAQDIEDNAEGSPRALQAIVEQKNTEIESLTKEMAFLQSASRESASKEVALQREVHEMQVKMKALQDEVAQEAKADNRLQEAESQVAVLEEQLTTLRIAHEELNMFTMVEHSVKEDSAVADIEAKDRELQELKIKLQVANAQIEELSLNAVPPLSQFLQSTSVKAVEDGHPIVERQTASEDAPQPEDADEDVPHLGDAMELQADAMSEDCMRMEIMELREKLQHSQTEMTSLREELENTREELATAQEEVDFERAEKEKAYNSNDDIRREVLIKAEMKALQKEILDLQEALGSANSLADHRATEAEELQKQLRRAEAAVVRQSPTKIPGPGLSQKEDELESSTSITGRDQMRTPENRRDSALPLDMEMQSKLVEQSLLVEHLTTEVEMYKTNLSNAEKYIQELKEEAGQEISTMEETVSHLTTQLEVAEAAKAEAIERERALQEEVEEALAEPAARIIAMEENEASLRQKLESMKASEEMVERLKQALASSEEQLANAERVAAEQAKRLESSVETEQLQAQADEALAHANRMREALSTAEAQIKHMEQQHKGALESHVAEAERMQEQERSYQSMLAQYEDEVEGLRDELESVRRQQEEAAIVNSSRNDKEEDPDLFDANVAKDEDEWQSAGSEQDVVNMSALSTDDEGDRFATPRGKQLPPHEPTTSPCPVHDALKWKVACIFQKFDENQDGKLNKEELMALMRAVNPHMAFTGDHLQAIVTEVFSMFPGGGGLPFEGLLATYQTDDSGDVNVDRDLKVLCIEPLSQCTCLEGDMDVESLQHFENALQMLMAEGRQVPGSPSKGSQSENSQQALARVRRGIAAWRQERQLLQASMAQSNMKMAELRVSPSPNPKPKVPPGSSTLSTDLPPGLVAGMSAVGEGGSWTQGTVKLTRKESDMLRESSLEKDVQIKSLSESIQQKEEEVLLLRSTPSSPVPPADLTAEKHARHHVEETRELEEKNTLLQNAQTELEAKLASALSSVKARELSMGELQAQLALVEHEMAQVKEQHIEETRALRAEPNENAKETSKHPAEELKQWLLLLKERSKDGSLPVDFMSQPELEALKEVQGMMTALVPLEGTATAISGVSQADLELEEQKLKVQELEITVQWREEELAEATRQQEATEQRLRDAAEHTAALQDGRIASSQRALEESHLEMDTMRKTLEELQAQLEEREALIQDKEEECSRYEAKMYHKDAMIKAMRRDSVVAMQEVEKAREQAAQDEEKAMTQRMTEQLNEQNESLRLLRDEAAQLRKANQSLESHAAGTETSTQTSPRNDKPMSIETENVSSSKTLIELANRIKERDAKLACQADQLQSAEREVDQLITWMADGERRLVTVEEQIFERVVQVEKLQEALAGAEAAAANADTKVAATNEEIAEANATTSLAAATAGMMQVKLSELESTVSEQEEQVRRAQMIYQAQVEENNKLQSSAQALEAEKAELLTKLASCEQSSSKRCSELQAAAIEIEKLQHSVLSLQSERGMVMKEDTDLKLNLLRRGGLFIKHNHHGRGSHERYVWITEDMDTICWGTRRGGVKRGADPLGSTTKTHPSSSTLPVSLISKVVKGKSTAVTMALGRRVETDALLSLESPMRTLDLQLPAKGNGLTRDQWASLFEWIIARHKTSDGVMQDTSPKQTPRLHSNKLFEVESTPATTQGTPSVQPQVTPSTGLTGVQATPSILSGASTVGADAQTTPGPMS